MVVWLLDLVMDGGSILVCGSLPTPGPGDTAAGTWWAHFEPIEHKPLACFKTAPSSKLLRR